MSEMILDLIKKVGMYEVGQAWKADHSLMGDNFRVAKSRTVSNIRRLQKSDPALLREYNKIMVNQLKDGVLEMVTDDMVGVVGRTYNMPHQLVVREDKETTKYRAVFDCSSKMEGSSSLNDNLRVPEAYYTDLFAVIVRFRTHQIGMVADIEKAFLRIRMREEDRDSHRLIWVKDPFAESLEFVTLRFTTVTFGAGPSMWQLGSVVKQHLKKYEQSHPAAVSEIERSLYADDLSSGGDEEDSACKLYKEVRQIFREAGMNLRKWRSNSNVVMEFIKKDEGLVVEQEDESADSYAATMLNPTDQSPVKVLGTPWNLEDDVLEISLEKLLERKDNVDTKRELLSVSHTLFDPFGLVAPLVFYIKCLFQKVCKDKGEWDDQIDEEVKSRWKRWIEGAERVPVFKIPRFYGVGLKLNGSKVMLIGFSDASKKGFAAVLYIRVENPDGGPVSASLVASKTRVAPLEEQSIPRMELLGGLILARLIKRTREILKSSIRIDEERCFIDSAVALHWIQNENKSYKQYVEKRASEIRCKAPLKNWRHVPGVENIADLPSRGCTPDVLDKRKDEWFYAPKWILDDESTWPVRKADELCLTEEQKICVEKEEKKTEMKLTKNMVLLAKTERNIEKIIDPTRYSSLTRLLRVTAICQKFIDMRVRKKNVGKEISAEDMDRAKDVWIRHLQCEMKKESKFLKSAESLGVKEDENGLLRCMGRLGRSKLPFDTKHPFLLPTYHWFTTLLIESCHDTVFHNGVRETLAEVRCKYWITKGRQRVRAVLKKCHLCKLLEGLAYPAPISTELPEFRVEGSGKAFKYTAVDFCGPVYVKHMYDKKSNEMNKAYILIMTCAESRMLHLELCPDLTTEAYVRGQERFIGRRGKPSMIISDNGKTFKGKLLREFNAENGIRWRFNLARAPWWGGLFERMVRSTKRCLRKAIGSQRLTFEELNTVLIKVEAVLNSRPLTYQYEDDVIEPITPFHLYRGWRLLNKDEYTDADEIPENETFEMKRSDVMRKIKKEDAVVDHFWKRWQKEYLVDLRETHKMKQPKAKQTIEVGDVVLVEEDGVKRNKWKLGCIDKLVIGKDGVVRGAEVKTTTKKGKRGVVSRPIQKLYPLESRDDSQSTPDAIEDTGGPSSVPMTLDTLTSNMSPNSIKENLSQKLLNVPSRSSSNARRKKSVATKEKHESIKKSKNAGEEEKAYASTPSSRPKRNAGIAGEKRRRIERN